MMPCHWSIRCANKNGDVTPCYCQHVLRTLQRNAKMMDGTIALHRVESSIGTCASCLGPSSFQLPPTLTAQTLACDADAITSCDYICSRSKPDRCEWTVNLCTRLIHTLLYLYQTQAEDWSRTRATWRHYSLICSRSSTCETHASNDQEMHQTCWSADMRRRGAKPPSP